MESSTEKSPLLDVRKVSDLPRNQELSTTLRELAISVQTLVNQFAQEHHDHTARERCLQGPSRDLVTEAINEESINGQPKCIPDWEEIEVMSLEGIKDENAAYLTKYEGILSEVFPIVQISEIRSSHAGCESRFLEGARRITIGHESL